MKPVIFIFVSTCLFALSTACRNHSPGQESAVESNALVLKDSSFRYNLDQPNSKFKLSKKLKEISGLCAYKDKWLMAVQDEKGSMYQIDIKDGSTHQVIKFSGKGDYEGLAFFGTTFYALRADGTIFKISNWTNEKSIQVDKIKTPLTEKNDTEGLSYDPFTNRLLLACKASSRIEEDYHKSRAVYAVDINTLSFDSLPVCNITRKQFKQFVKTNYHKFPSYKPYKKEMKKAKKEIIIQPSAIAVHPISKHYYILSAMSNSLLVVNRQNEIMHVKRLSRKRFEQPEGLTFSTNGDLFIASEGLKKKAKIYKFDYQAR
jgi:uncharacterized protein YjiK